MVFRKAYFIKLFLKGLITIKVMTVVTLGGQVVEDIWKVQGWLARTIF